MDAQCRRIEEALEPVSEEDLWNADRAMPWGTPVKMGQGLVDMVVKCLAAYRMQLFLYAKAAGAHQLGPANCWMGVDPPAPADGGRPPSEAE
jgi:hypothetical protein